MPEADSRFLRACRQQPVDATPVWFMRQAGRYLPEYRALRSHHGILDICKRPDLAAEVTVTAVEKLGVDTAIIFSDLLLPVEAMGMKLRFAAGEGPLLENPLRDAAAIRGLQTDRVGELAFVGEAIGRVKQHFAGRVPVIGFAGAPFTLSSYMIEGGASRDYAHTKSLMYRAPEVWAELMEKLCAVLEPYLLQQVAAGADAIMLFDSWVGCLALEDYVRYAQPYVQRLVQAVRRQGVPVIHFGTGTAHLLRAMDEAGADVLGVDWRLPLRRAWEEVGFRPAIQGNLDPTALLAPLPELRRRVEEVLAQAAVRPGHIFNLGHGVLPGTPVHPARNAGRKCARRGRNRP